MKCWSTDKNIQQAYLNGRNTFRKYKIENIDIDDLLIELKQTSLSHILYNKIKGSVITKIYSLLQTGLEIIEDNTMISASCSNNAVLLYLYKLDTKKYKKHVSPNDNHITINKVSIPYLSACHYIVRFADNDLLLVDNQMDKFSSTVLTFIGKHRYQHWSFFEKMYEKYYIENLSIKQYTYALSQKGSQEIVSSSQWIEGRKENTVIMNEEAKESLFKYLDVWRQKKDFFQKYHLAHKTGILLYGEAGTGKTSLAKAIATRYNFHLVKLKIAAIPALSNQNDITSMFANSVVLLEDIDCNVTDRNSGTDNEVYKQQFQELLNLLDGTNTYDSTIFVATTNCIEKLDKALIRDGRFDFKISMSDFTKNQAIQLCKLFNMDEKKILESMEFPVNPAHLQKEIMVTLFNDMYDSIKIEAELNQSDTNVSIEHHNTSDEEKEDDEDILTHKPVILGLSSEDNIRMLGTLSDTIDCACSPL